MLTQYKKKSLNNWNGNVCLWLVLFLTLGYPIQAAVPILLNVPSTPINFAFRVVYVIMALILIFSSLGKKNSISKGARWLLIFWGMYSVRLIIDISYRGIVFGNKDSFFIYSMAFGNCLLPMIAIIFNAKYVDVKKIHLKIYGMVLISNLLLVLMIFIQNGGLSASLLDLRIDITGQNSDEQVINAIIIGFYGNALFILSLYFLVFFKFKNILTRSIVLFFSAIGLFNLIISASRGPFLTMLAVSLFIFYFKYKTTNFKIAFFFKGAGLFIVAFYFLAIGGFLNNFFKRSTLFTRLGTFQENLHLGVKEIRDYEYAGAFDQFYNNPIIGDQYVTKYDSFYPHNIYLEVLMSLGVVGGIVFLLVHFEIMKRIIFIFKKHDFLYFLILLILLLCFLSALTSGGMALNPGIWAITALFVSLKYQESKPEGFKQA